MGTTTAEAQRVALAEKVLAEEVADVMAKAALEIRDLCQLTIQALLVKFQPDAVRGPVPRIHCVIVAAKLPEDVDNVLFASGTEPGPSD